VLGVLVYVLWLGTRDFWYPGEPDLAEICRAMFDSGDWTVPRRNGEIFLNYGPLFFWAGTLSSHLLGGLSEFALRLPSALAAIGLVVATSLVGSRWFGPRAGLWAGLLLLVSWEFSWQAIGFRVDMLFALFVGLGIFTYASGTGPKPRWTLRVAGFVLLGLAVLVKGPLGLLLPGLVLTLWHAGRREWRALLELAPLAMVAVAVALPWHVASAMSLGTETVIEEFTAQNFNRFGSGERGHGRPAYYYIARIWIDLTLWAVLLPFALWWIFRREIWRDRRVQLALWWFGTFFLFLSFAATKRKLYLIPAYPAASLLLARWISSLGEEPAEASSPDARPAQAFAVGFWILLAVVAVASLAAAAGLGWIVGRLDVPETTREVLIDLRLPALGIGLTMAALWLWVGRVRRRGELPLTLRHLALAQVALYLLVVAWVFPTLNPLNTYAPVGRWIAAQTRPDTRLGYLGSDRKVGAFGYYTGKRIDRVESRSEIEAFFQAHPDSLVVLEEKRAREFLAGQETYWSGLVVREFEAARRRYFVLRGPGDAVPSAPSPRDPERNAGQDPPLAHRAAAHGVVP
jgi:4-amino-4-deoxy-L-arabinose transferase-like glycosyltransferase